MAVDGTDPIQALGATSVLVRMEGQNQNDELPGTPDVTVSVHVIAAAHLAREELMSRQELMDYERKRALEEDCQPGIVRPNGEQGPLEGGTSPNGH